MRFHVLTAVSRPENLPLLARSLADGADGHEIVWQWRFDLEQSDPGGNRTKDEMLLERGMWNGWVYVLDDDTLLQPGLFSAAAAAAGDGYDALIVSQRRPDLVLHAKRKNVHPGGIDIGQAVISRDLLGQTRIPHRYDGDGDFLCEVLGRGRVRFLDRILSVHNALA